MLDLHLAKIDLVDYFGGIRAVFDLLCYLFDRSAVRRVDGCGYYRNFWSDYLLDVYFVENESTRNIKGLAGIKGGIFVIDWMNFRLDNEDTNTTVEELGTSDIAIIGMAVRLPGADNSDRFWNRLINGEDSVRPFPAERWNDVRAYMRACGLEDDPSRYYEGAFLEEVDKFDYGFFRISPKEASLMNPNQRLFLENAWSAIEDAGYGGEKIKGSRTGVFVGYNADAFHDYKRMIDRFEPESMSLAIPGNLSSMIAGRLSYLLDLKGPAICVDTACSSSLVAVHLAVHALRRRECEMAVAGSVKVNLLPFHKDMRIGIESSDGRARTFDDRSDGTGAGEGAGTVLLKPLHAALRDGDAVYAVIKGSAVNQDGHSIGLTAPNVEAQTDVICRAWEDAGIEPHTIRFIEAHGTGTKLGDPIEIEAIRRAFRRYTDRSQFCAIGALKSSNGHLDNAAGIVGLIKSALMLKHGGLPPTLHFERPNRNIDFIDSPVFVNDRYRVMDYQVGVPRRGGVSAFGMSGTNCHVVLEEAPADAGMTPRAERYDSQVSVFALSAQSEQALLRLVGRYVEQEARWLSYSVRDICYTLATGRKHEAFRIGMVVRDTAELSEKLRQIASTGWNKSVEGVFFGMAGRREDENGDGTIDSLEDGEDLCRQYTDGVRIDWERKYGAENRRRVNLPSYVFEPARCWLRIDSGISAVAGTYGEPLSQVLVELRGRERENDYTVYERGVAAIWSEVLGVTRIGIDERYFDLGGDSILALRIVHRINERFGMQGDTSVLFQYPTIKELAAVIELQNEGAAAPNRPALLEPARLMNQYPLSSAQKRIYILQMLEPSSTAYHLPQALLLEGQLDIERLESAFQQILDRHEIFRASFHMEGQGPIQLFADRVHVPIDIWEVAESDIQDVIDRFVRPFDLSRSPLIRVLLLRVSERRHVFVLDKHHIITDGTSMGILTHEFMRLYNGRSLDKQQLQYKDYAVWQNALIGTPYMDAQKSYWLETFSDKIPVLQLPTDFSRPAIKSNDGRTFETVLDETTTAAVRRLAQVNGTTLYMVLLAAYNVMLHHYSGQEDIVVGSPISGRSHRLLEPLIGMFVNTLPMRNYPARDKPFLQFLQEVKERALMAYRHQDYPFEELIRALGVQDKSHNPLFDTMFILQNIDLPNVELSGMSCCEFPITNRTSKFDLMVQTFDTGAKLRFVVEYCDRLFREETVRRMIKHYMNILRCVADYPEKPIGLIDMLDETDKSQILLEFNRPAMPIGKYKPIHRLFEAQVRRDPDRPAVIGLTKTLTYGDLNEKANCLARVLRAKGIRRDTIVGVMANRSPELVIGMIAVLKAGGAYLPIDPLLPSERIAFMLADSNSKVLLVGKEFLDHACFAGQTIVLDESSWLSDNSTNLSIRTSPHDLFYVIYTSGSTGQPKGVMVEHRSFHNFALSIEKYYGGRFGEKDRCLSLTSISFDVSVCELFLPLVHGAALVLYPEARLTNMNGLVGMLIDHSITFAYLPPTLLNEICDMLEKRRGEVRLNKLLVGVEPIKDDVLLRYMNLNPELTVINGYGPSEATICSNMFVYEPNEPTGRNVPIGKPLHHNQVYILNEFLLPAPIGATGELYISGAGLARGYLNQPALTAEKFVDNPFIPGERMYRTGDLARWTASGDVEYIGRVDFQVKIRGYRIEPGEIEAVMLTQPEIADVIVLPLEEETGNKALCAYYVPDGEVSQVKLRSELLRRLPDYMVPSWFMSMDRIPVTSNGKVDRKALPVPERLVEQSNYEAPSGPLQEKLAEVWRAVLDMDRVGIRDNFFELGGHSLQVIRLEMELENRQIPIGDQFVYNHPTIAQQAAYLSEQMDEAGIALFEKLELDKNHVDLESFHAARR